MFIAVMNNLPELLVGVVYSSAVFWAGTRVGRWRANH